jgi:hypothetical protein
LDTVMVKVRTTPSPATTDVTPSLLVTPTFAVPAGAAVRLTLATMLPDEHGPGFPVLQMSALQVPVDVSAPLTVCV